MVDISQHFYPDWGKWGSATPDNKWHREQTWNVHQAGKVHHGVARHVPRHRYVNWKSGESLNEWKHLHETLIRILIHFHQGEMVNRIDTHVESAVEYTTRATNDTKKALEYQSKARRKKIMMMLCMIIAGGLGTYMGGRYLNLF